MTYKVFDEFGGPRLTGAHKSLVRNNLDPEKRGRIKLDSPVMGTDTDYIDYLYPPGTFFPPSKGSIVTIEFDGGNREFPFIFGQFVSGESPELPESFQKDIPTVRGLYTPGDLQSDSTPISATGGHLLELDDGDASIDDEDAEPIQITQTKANKGIRLTTSKGNKIHIFEEESDGSGRNDIVIETSTGIQIKLNENDTDIDIKVDGGQVNLIADRVRIGDEGAGQRLVRGDELDSYLSTLIGVFNSHVHPGVTSGASSTATTTSTQSAPSSSVFSSVHKVE